MLLTYEKVMYTFPTNVRQIERMKNMEKKNKLILIISIIGLILVVAGASYAYFSARITGLESASTLSMTAGTLGIAYSEGNEIVTAPNIYPRETEWITKTFRLTGNNTTDLKMNYMVGLQIEENTFDDGDLTYTLTHTNESVGTPIENVSERMINQSGKQVIGYGQFESGTGMIQDYTLKIYFKDNGNPQTQGRTFSAHIIVEDYASQELLPLAPNNWYEAEEGKLLYALRNDEANKIQDPLTTPGAEISFNLERNSVQMPLEVPAQLGWKIKAADTRDGLDSATPDTVTNVITALGGYDNFEGKYIQIVSGTGADNYIGMKAYISDVTLMQNVPVEGMGTLDEAHVMTAINVTTVDATEDEALLASTEDDYGTSYYYRGAVENNYVSFAGMCWRIVRVAGDGSIKLTLYNYASSSCNVDNSTGAFARVDGDTYTSAFNTNWDKNAYVGYMYGTAGSSSYNDEHANLTDSTILSKLKTWYASSFTSAQKELLADTIWCNDKRTVSDTTYDPQSITPTGFGYNTEKTYYQAMTRLVNSSNSRGGTGPSLKCGNSKTDNKLSKFSSSITSDKGYGNGALNGYKIGLLTADEVAYAGGAFGRSNESYYLNANANESSTWWWLMSPSNFDGSAGAWRVYSSGILDNGGGVGNSNAVRPAVSLKSTTNVTGGTGSKSTPFTIE